METRIIRDKKEIFNFLSCTPVLHLYTIGDLDDFFWPDTTWYALYEDNKIVSIALLYSGMSPSTLLLFYEKDPTNSRVLLASIRKFLPWKFNVHLSPGLMDVLGMENVAEKYGHNNRMILVGEPEQVNVPNIRRLTSDDINIMYELYLMAYPHNWFDSRMLKTGKYFGYFESERLVGIAGVHVYSPEYRIAALGNIATHPEFRGRKIAYKVTSALCNDLKESTDIIGLNVKSDNKAAIKCYQNIGFEIKSSFDEYLIKDVR
jgi:ribosomal protein S18 acetylase RimI-like enzyme